MDALAEKLDDFETWFGPIAIQHTSASSFERWNARVYVRRSRRCNDGAPIYNLTILHRALPQVRPGFDRAARVLQKRGAVESLHEAAVSLESPRSDLLNVWWGDPETVVDLISNADDATRLKHSHLRREMCLRDCRGLR